MRARAKEKTTGLFRLSNTKKRARGIWNGPALNGALVRNRPCPASVFSRASGEEGNPANEIFASLRPSRGRAGAGRAADQAGRAGAAAGRGATNASAARTASGIGSASIRPVASWRTCTVVIRPRATSVHLPARSF